MATSTLTQPLEQAHLGSSRRGWARVRGPRATATPAANAAAMISRTNLALGALGIATAVFLTTRLLIAWRIDPQRDHNTISVLGRRLSYPAANVSAILVVALATIGLAVAVTAFAAGMRELAGSWRLRRSLGHRVGRSLPDGTLVIEDPVPHAFCAGLARPRVYITSAAIARLDPDALRAVLAHEQHHVDRRDPLRLAAGRVLARSLFFVPWLGRLHERQTTLAELGADENAAAAGTPALARALLAFDGSGSSGIDPARVDRLLAAEPPTWRFPMALALSAAGTIALLAATAALAARFASGTATLAPPFLSRQPCVVVLAAIPTLVTLAGWRLARIRASCA